MLKAAASLYEISVLEFGISRFPNHSWWAIVLAVYVLDEIVTSLLLLSFLRRPRPSQAEVTVHLAICEVETESTALISP